MREEGNSTIFSESALKVLKRSLVVAAVIVAGVVVYWAIWADSSPVWTGFGAYDEVGRGPRAKTLWDWLGLLIVPAVLALGALWFNPSCYLRR